jgi:integrase/recombinase XerD
MAGSPHRPDTFIERSGLSAGRPRGKRAAQKSGKSAPQKLPKTLGVDEVAALMAMPNLDCPTGLRDRCMLELMYRTGLRAGEACGVHLRDVDWREGVVRVRAEIAKYSKEAVLPLDGRVVELLERWKPVRRLHARGTPHLFCTVRGAGSKPVARQDLWEMTQRRARKAGIDRDVWPHMLRHTYATELLREGFTIDEVRRLMRHSDIRVTAIYLHIADRELTDKVQRRA